MKARNVLVVFTCLAAWQVSCLSMEDPADQALRDNLARFEAAAAATVTDIAASADTAYELNQALQADDMASADGLLDTFDAQLGSLVASTTDLDAAEAAILDAGGQDWGAGTATLHQPLLPLIGWGIAAASLYVYTSTLKTLSNEMSEARRQRDAAEFGSAEEAAAKATMKEKGLKAIETVTEKVSTDLVTHPLSSGAKAALELKDLAGAALGQGKDVIGATDSCKDGVAASGCKIVVNRTDGAGKVSVPAGTVHVAVSGGGTARAKVENVTTQPDETKTVQVPQVPIAEATVSGLAEYDGNGGGPSGSGTTTTGTWPPETVDGMQIQYTVTGARLSAPTDRPAPVGELSWQRSYSGALDGSALRVQGVGIHDMNHPSGTEWGDFPATVEVVVTVNESTQRFFDQTDPNEGPWSAPFDVSVPVPEGAYFGYFRVVVTFVNPRYGDREVRITGELSGP